MPVSLLMCCTGTTGLPLYNIWENVFTPEKMAMWGDTVVMYVPGVKPPGPDLMKVGSSKLCLPAQLQAVQVIEQDLRSCSV